MSFIPEKLAKFGLQYYDLETMIDNVGFMLRLMAINIDARRPNPSYVLRGIASCILASYFYVYVFSVACQLFAEKSEDTVSTVLLLSLTFTSILIVVKISLMYLNHGAMQEIVSGYLDCDSNVNHNSRFGKNVLSSLRNVKKRALIFCCVIFCDTSIYTFMPFFKKDRCFADENLILYGLDRVTESPYYEIGSALTTCAMFAVTYITSFVGSFFIIICGYTEAYMLSLGKELEALYGDAIEHYEQNNETNESQYDRERNYYRNEKIAKFIEHRLVHIAKGHIVMLDLVSKVQDAHQKSLVAELVLLMISIIIDLLGGLENTAFQMPYSLLMVGTDCLAGQKIMDASDSFERAVYACNWENFDPPNRKKVLLMLMNAQKTLTLSAGSVTTLSVETFGKILKTIYSAYTTLRSTLNTT